MMIPISNRTIPCTVKIKVSLTKLTDVLVRLSFEAFTPFVFSNIEDGGLKEGWGEGGRLRSM